MSALGSKADICNAIGHVRFTPKSGHVRSYGRCLLCANSGHSGKSARCLLARRYLSGRWAHDGFYRFAKINRGVTALQFLRSSVARHEALRREQQFLGFRYSRILLRMHRIEIPRILADRVRLPQQWMSVWRMSSRSTSSIVRPTRCGITSSIVNPRASTAAQGPQTATPPPPRREAIRTRAVSTRSPRRRVRARSAAQSGRGPSQF